MHSKIREYLPIGTHPQTGEPFLENPFKIDQKSGCESVTFYVSRPDPPSLEYIDDDDCVVIRTDEEMQKLTAYYESALAAWIRAGSVTGPQQQVVRVRPDEVTGTFWTASGACAYGVRAPNGEWNWLRTESTGAVP